MVDQPPSHVEETAEQLAALHHEQERATGPVQKFANRVTAWLGRPGTLAVIFLLIILWMVGNYVARRMGVSAVDQFPFPDLAFFATVAALLIALLILTTQQHQSQLAERRSQLTLQISILSEKKIAKVIALIEEQRRESPVLASRIDNEAEAMSQSVDPRESLNSLERAVEEKSKK